MSCCDIISRARAGDRDAEAALLEDYRPYAERLACDMARHADSREDLVQEGLMRLLRVIRAGNVRHPRAAFRAAIFLGMSKAIRAQRNYAATHAPLVDMDPPSEAEDGPEASNPHLATLTDVQRQVITWRYGLDGLTLTNREIAERLGILDRVSWRRRVQQITKSALEKLRE